MVYWATFLHQRISQLESELQSLKELLLTIEADQLESKSEESSAKKFSTKQQRRIVDHQRAREWYRRELLKHGKH